MPALDGPVELAAMVLLAVSKMPQHRHAGESKISRVRAVALIP